MAYSKDELDEIFDKCTKVRGKDPDMYRKDAFDTLIKRDEYGNTGNTMGWEVDHSHPKAKGGTDNMRNLQAMGISNNRSKSDKYPYK